MAKILSLLSLRTDIEGESYLNPSTLPALQKAVSKSSFNILCDVDGIKFPNYIIGDVTTPFEQQGVIVLVRSSDGLVLDKFGRYYGYSEWSAIKEMCRRHFKRGRHPDEFIVLLMTEADYKNVEVKCTYGKPRHYFNIEGLAHE